ncbi:hypothetical protein [Hydrogenovibrio kuenenii]|uniref:hypothetical protein n=1 Tax=Hydrogenovibrio kuenenii TaxID=63658 RepID=UPI0004635AF2|nr:hypothetical protein [Hydrogenovibrio kuenenii]
MLKSLKIALLVLCISFIPMTLWNAGYLFTSESCDPKFGCQGTFFLKTYILSFSVILSTFTITIAHYFILGRHNIQNTRKVIIFTFIFALILGVIGNESIMIAQKIGIATLIALWVAIPLFISIGFFESEKNKLEQSTQHS